MRYFADAPDLLKPERFESMRSLAFATNVYHEEAVAYAHWFGKFLCRRFNLQAGNELLEPKIFCKILPKDLKLWDEAQYSNSEFVRIAVDRDTLYKEFDEEFEQREQNENGAFANRMIYEEWERRPGFSYT
jgi:hypothetical protein